MLAPHHHQFSRHYQMYQNKLITIISPYTGEQIKIELSGEEREFRELVATLLNIDPSFIKGLKDSFGNYYTISSALKDPFIFSTGNNLFSLVLSISNNNFNKYKNYTNAYNKNILYNINNNYHNRTEYNEIYRGNESIDYNYDYKKKKKINYRKYSKLIKKLIPAINRNFREEEEYEFEQDSSYLDEWSLGQRVKYQKILENIKSNFNKEQMNILRELLKMENIGIINFFKIYDKSKNKKDLLKNLKLLSKKYQKKLKNKIFSENEEEEEEEEETITNSNNKGKKNRKHNNKNENTSSEEESSSHEGGKKKNAQNSEKCERSCAESASQGHYHASGDGALCQSV